MGSDRPQRVFSRELQQERTALAWDRTAVAMIVGGALFVRAGQPPYHEVRHAPGLVAIVFGATLIVLASRRYDAMRRRLDAGHAATSPRLVLATGLFTVAFAVAALGLVIVGG